MDTETTTPSMQRARGVFSFPNPVNDVAARVTAAGVLALAAAALASRVAWVTVPLAYGFVARVLAGPRLSPLGLFATRVAAPRISAHPRLVPGPPKRFAQALGALFSVSAAVCWLGFGLSSVAEMLLGVLVVCAGLEAGLGFCIGCRAFALATKLGLVPASVCAECADIWSRAAGPRTAGGA
jgi:hypothetical protein